MQDIHGIRPPVQVGFDIALLKFPFMVMGVILLLVLMFFLIKKWWKKRKQPDDLKHLPRPLAPYEAALRQLDLLFRKNMDEPRVFYFDLTAILRKYIGGCFGFNAIEMTSQEFAKSINLIELDKDLKKDLLQFQKISDPFKYAGHVPEAIRVKEDLAFVRRIIDQIEDERVEEDQVEHDRIKGEMR